MTKEYIRAETGSKPATKYAHTRKSQLTKRQHKRELQRVIGKFVIALRHARSKDSNLGFFWGIEHANIKSIGSRHIEKIDGQE